MTSAPPASRSRWPALVGLVSIFYGLACGGESVARHLDSLSARYMMQVALAAWIVAGGVGVVMRQSWGRVALLSGAYLLLGELALVLCVVLLATAFNSSQQPVSVYFSAVTFSAVAAWPLFLVV